MKSLFVSVPMEGRTEEEIRADMEKCRELAEQIVGEPLEVTDSICPWRDKPVVYALGYGVIAMSLSDYVCFASGWEDYKGCRIEREIAERYSLNIIEIPA